MTDASDPAMQAILQKLGYEVKDLGITPGADWQPDRLLIKAYHRGWAIPTGDRSPLPEERELGLKWCWATCLAHAESGEGLERNFAKIVTMLLEQHPMLSFSHHWTSTVAWFDGIAKAVGPASPTPQAAAWRLLLKVRGVKT